MWNVAHLHIAINHIPVILIPAALVILAVGVWRRSEAVFRTGIVVAWAGVAFGLATYFTGDAAADLVMAVEKAQEKTLDPIVGEHDASAGWALGSAVLQPKEHRALRPHRVHHAANVVHTRLERWRAVAADLVRKPRAATVEYHHPADDRQP